VSSFLEGIWNVWNLQIIFKVSRSRRILLNRVFAPEGEILSFAPPKESIQRKGGPDAASILRSEAFIEGRQKGLPSPSADAPLPCGAPSGCSR
jgi:hypothetical protein